MSDDPTILGYKRLFIIAGAVGIVTSIVYHKDGWRAAIVRSFAGASCVLFVAPAGIKILARYVEMNDEMAGLLFWAAGMSGIAIVNLLAKAMRNPLAFVQEWLRVKQGGGPAP